MNLSFHKIFKLCVCLNADIGADVLDLAETMVASDGLKYEPVSNTHIHCSFALYSSTLLHNIVIAFLTVKSFTSHFRSTLSSLHSKDCGTCKMTNKF